MPDQTSDQTADKTTEKLPNKVHGRWQLTTNLKSPAEGFFGEGRDGEDWQCRDGPNFGAHNGPSVDLIEKTLSPIKIEPRLNTWWKRAISFNPWSIFAIVCILAVGIASCIVIVMMTFQFIPVESRRSTVLNDSAVNQTQKADELIPIIIARAVPHTKGFVTVFRAAPSEEPTSYSY
ncbi:hypothetical protein N7520_004845 [Penicillium odoratum]|uniref:uncharacterized protein n=1 Tax=Penicillium odoratum TaxID=1167516 RepID=UPI0025499B6B|nr:uncharacterized protein N7520_004845 [Penicillium odoratum]KAJ5765286.1 hypothetical protein N7520_004845 [Penicillium odoratum]